MKVIAIVQARMSSTRLPAKVLLDLYGKPIILRMLERLIKSKRCNNIIIATTINPIDNIISDLCIDSGLEFYRGHPTDLLDRHYHCAKKYKADLILKIPSDCPLIDPSLVDECIELIQSNNYDYASNIHSHNFPDGQDVEAFSMDALEYSYKKANKEYQREHTTPYIYENKSLFKTIEMQSPYEEKSFYKYRLTLDYIEDYWLIRKVYNSFNGNVFTLKDIIKLLDSNNYIRNINSLHHSKAWYNNKNILN